MIKSSVCRNLFTAAGIVLLLSGCNCSTGNCHTTEQSAKITENNGKQMEMARKFDLFGIFSSHMVLQRERPVVISGTAEAGKCVNVAFAGMTRCAEAGQNGEWQAEFPPMQAGGPYKLTVTGAGEKVIKLTDILIGEVWLCSGQSNMEMPVYSENPFYRTLNFEEELKNAAHHRIRFFNAIPLRTLAPDAPLRDVPGGKWQICDADSLKSFSACGYFFGRQLHQDLNVPVGLIAAAWGGTPIESWISREMLNKCSMPETPETKKHFARYWDDIIKMLPELQDWLKKFNSLGDAAPEFLQLECDEAGFEKIKGGVIVLPRPGRYLYRMKFELPENFAGKDICVTLGVVNDADRTFFNGEFVGATQIDTPACWSVCRKYKVPGRLVKSGTNCLAVIADDYFSTGSIQTEQLKITSAEQTITVQPESCRRTVFITPADFPPRPNIPPCVIPSPDSPGYPSTLFNSMLYPWFRYAVRGVIWYQGCDNRGETTYYTMHKAFIDDLRKHWNDPDMPFLLVQLAAFQQSRMTEPFTDEEVENFPVAEYPPFAVTREIQAEMPRVRNNVGLVTAFDRGDHSDIHPRDKQTVGFRLAKKAESMVYGSPALADGPEFAGFRIEDGRIRVFFRNTGSGLITSDGKAPTGFYVGGKTDGKLVKAEAKIDGNSVIVWCDSVWQPQRVRYAFTGYCKVNLMNKEGFPAVPFRSDKTDYKAMFAPAADNAEKTK